MSLQIAAKHLATKGRGPDTTLVHMTNKEVQGLQALAQKNGGSLSINPETGLPEAGFLESILPVVAGVGLTAAGMGPMAAALTVGGVSALSTGSLSKGLFAGLGAYGGASLGEQLAVQGMGEAAAANASFGDKLAGMGDASAFSSFENAGKFISANKLPAMAGIAGPLLSSMEDERENDKPAEPVKDTDPGARARSGIKYNPGWTTPTPLPNPYGIEQTYGTPYYAAEGGVTHMAEGGMAYGGSTSIDTKSQFADYLNKVMNPTNRTNAVSGSTNPYEWWKSPSTPATPAAPPAETAEEYAARARANARGSSGGRGEREPEDPNSFSAQWAGMSDAEKEAWRAENPKTAAAQDLAMLIGSPFMFAYNKLQEYMGPESSTGGPARFARTPVVPNENDEPGDRYAPAYSPTLSPSSLDPSQQAKALAGYTNAQFSGVEPAPQATPQTSTVDYSTGLYNDLSNRPDSSFPAGTNYTDKAFTRDVFGRVLSPDAPYTSGATTSSNTALVRQNPIAGSDMQRALNSQAKSAAAVPNINPVDPYAVDSDYTTDKNITYTAAEQARIDRDAAMRSLQMAIERESPDSIAKYQAQVNDLNNKLAALNGEPSAVAQTDTALGSSYNLGPFTNSNLNDSPFNQGPFNAANTAATTAATTARINALREAMEKSPYEKDIEAREKRDAAQEEKNAAIQAALESAPSIPFSLSTIPTGTDLVGTSSSPLGTNTPISPNGPDLTSGTLPTINPKDPYAVDSDYGNFERAPYVPGAISAAPDDTTLSQFTNALYGNTTLPAGYVGDGTQLAGVGYTGGIPDGSTLAGLQGGYNPGYATPNMGNVNRGPGLAGISGIFGNLGSVWKNNEGNPWVGSDGKPVLTSQGAAENAFNASPEGIAAENAREMQSLQNRYGGGRSSDGGDGGGYSGAPSGGDGVGRSPPGSAHDGQQGYGGPSDARGGYLQNGKFDQRMAYGGLSAMPNPYNLGSYSDGGRLLKGPGDGVSDSIPATIGKGRPARLADGEFVIPARIVSEIGNGSTEAGARKLYAMMDRIQASRSNTVGKGKVAVNNRADKYLPA
jgi:hypothetical protein